MKLKNIFQKVLGWIYQKYLTNILRDYRVPVFEYEITNGVLMYRWNNVIDGFDMPNRGNNRWGKYIIYPTLEFKQVPIKKPLH